MSTDRLPETEEGVGALVKGIVKDLENLALQHIRLFKKDLQEDVRKIREGMFELAIGVGIILIGGFLLAVGLAELLNATVLPAMNLSSETHRWVSYGILGILITGSGAFLLYRGQQEVRSAAPIADKTMEALEEDVQWMKNPK